MRDTTQSDWDPTDSSVLRDQRLAYDDMRERCPVAHSEFLDWSLFRHEDIVRVLHDPETFSSESKRLAIPNGMDPPAHTLYRGALEQYFTPERMAAFEPECRRIAADLLQSFVTNSEDEIEFVTEFAEPFPLKALCAFLGWPSNTWERLLGWTHGNQQVSFSRDREMARALARIFTGYVSEAILVRRQAGTSASDDITTGLMNLEVAGKRLSDDDIVSILRNWTAGKGTVAASIGLLVLHLAQNPTLQTRLREDPALIPAAIEEILRIDGPLVSNRRTTTRDVEIGGRTIGTGERLTLIWIAANRDGRVFDDADNVRFDRDESDNLLFGSGIHDCIGASLARLEMRIALEELLAHTTHIQLAGDGQVSRSIVPSNGLQAMTVRLI